MPNQPLIEKLDTLRETYAAQQKAANNLQSALKGLSNAANKAGRGLRDYGEAAQEAQAQLDRMRIKEALVEPILPDLRRELKTLGALATALRDASAALRVEPVDIIRLDRALRALRTVARDDVDSLLPELLEELEIAQRALGADFGEALRDALAEQGLQIGGRPPHFEVGRFEIDANFAKRSAVILYGRDVVIPRTPLSLEAVLKAYQTAVSTIMGRAENGPKWMENLHTAYELTRRKRGSDNPRVNLVECYITLVELRQGRAYAVEPSKRTFVDYSRAQFVYDFFEFVHRAHLTHQGYAVVAHVATRTQAESPAKSLWIVEGDGPFDGRYISDIEFRKD
jgi:hypothetical protein